MNLKSFVRLIPCVLMAALCVAQTAKPRPNFIFSSRLEPGFPCIKPCDKTMCSGFFEVE